MSIVTAIVICVFWMGLVAMLVYIKDILYDIKATVERIEKTVEDDRP